MPSPAFSAAIPFILRWEGGYVNNPNDPGGATNRGVTQKVYDRFRQAQGQAPRDVRQLEDAELYAIYESGYWLPPRCDVLPGSLDLVQLDTAVNMGVGRAVQFLQKSVGCTPDGAFGSQTEQAARDCSLAETITAYCAEREAYYRWLAQTKPTLQTFLKGWLNRLNALRKEVGLPATESAGRLDFGDAGYIKRLPDLGEDPSYDRPN